MLQAVRTGNPRSAGVSALFMTLVFAAVADGADVPGRGAERELAGQILEAANIHGGLIVHLHCGDGKLTAALGAGDHCLVHGLNTNAEEVGRARKYLQKLGVYGPVSVERFDGKRLPYAENLVNLIVAEDLGDVAMGEAMRVLAPGGVVYGKQDGRWTKTVKPRPDNIDEWTHYLHDASGNAVAGDDVVGPPGHLQWSTGPRHTRSHEHTPGVQALVSNGPRIFYLVDEAPIDSIRGRPQWHLAARDAFNGTLLWKRSVATWFPHIVNWCQSPLQLQRRLVAVGDRVYVTLGLHSPLSVLDATTGDVLDEYENTRGTEEIVCHDGILLLAVRNVTSQRTDELARWARLVEQKGSPLYARETAEPLVKRLRATEAGGEKSVLALEADSGRLLWKKTGAEIAGLRPLTLCAHADRAFYENGKDVVCLDLKSGRQRWSVAPPARLRVVHDGRVFCAGGKTVTALSAQTGATLWAEPASLVDFRDVFVAGGSLWLGGFKPIEGKRSPAWGPYFVTGRDPATGKILMRIEPENPSHHHRCYSNKATDRYILGGRRGTEFIDLATGDVLWHSWARGVCRYGVMPCNGLLYTPPHACGCYMTAKLTGFSALAPVGKAESGKPKADVPARLERGPAYGSTDSAPGSEPSEEWPTYRGDAQRSGLAQSAVPVVLQRRWQTDIGGKLTAPTVAGGQVLVAAVDRHEVVALDADSGASAWHFTTGARVDSPPTVYTGQAIFGCRDGYVYSVRASDGVLAWRRQAARQQRRIVVDGQLESVSPVLGSVLIRDDVVYCTSGRSSYLDGGIDLHRIEPGTGKLLSQTPIFSPDPQTGRQPPQSAPAVMPGARADILTADGDHVYLRDMVFDPDGGRLKQGTDHLFTLTDFLDDSWPHRSYWIFGTRCSIATGCSRRDKNVISGRLLVLGDATIFGYGRKLLDWSNRLQDGAYRLFATNRAAGTEEWSQTLPIQVRAMLLSDTVLFVAGPTVSAADPLGSGDEQPASMLLAVSATDGTVLAEYPLDAPPVFDGLAAAVGRLYLTTIDGKVTCFGGEKATARSPLPPGKG